MRRAIKWAGGILAAIAAAYFLFFALHFGVIPNPFVDECGDKYEAIMAAKDAVLMELKSAATATFPAPHYKIIPISTGDCGWNIYIEVDSQNGFGAIMRATAIVELERHKESGLLWPTEVTFLRE